MTTYELEIDDRLVGLHAHLAALRLQQEQLGHSFYALLGDAPAVPLAGVPEDAQGNAPQGEERVLYGRPRSIGAEKAAQAVRSVAGLAAGPVVSWEAGSAVGSAARQVPDRSFTYGFTFFDDATVSGLFAKDAGSPPKGSKARKRLLANLNFLGNSKPTRDETLVLVSQLHAAGVFEIIEGADLDLASLVATHAVAAAVVAETVARAKSPGNGLKRRGSTIYGPSGSSLYGSIGHSRNDLRNELSGGRPTLARQRS